MTQSSGAFWALNWELTKKGDDHLRKSDGAEVIVSQVDKTAGRIDMGRNS